MSKGKVPMSNPCSKDRGRNQNDTTRSVLFGIARWKSVPHYRLRAPAFFRLFQPGATISRTFRKKSKPGEFRLIRGNSNRFRPKQWVGAGRRRLDFCLENQTKSNLLKPNQTCLKSFIDATLKQSGMHLNALERQRVTLKCAPRRTRPNLQLNTAINGLHWCS